MIPSVKSLAIWQGFLTAVCVHKTYQQQFILTLICKDDFGIVAAVASCLTNLGAFIVESAQFGDTTSDRFFLRALFSVPNDKARDDYLIKELTPIISRFSMQWHLQNANYKPRTLIMASTQSHCLSDLMHRVASGLLPIEVVGVASNHTDLKAIAQWHQVPFFHLPIAPQTKEQQVQILDKMLTELRVDLVILARYMQVLSKGLTQKLLGKAINIHHSFLPSFKGAKPYHQAFERGVKVIGATAHYITEDLDEGPIIEQETIRVNHAHTPALLAQMGRDVECAVLARAIALHVQRRVLMNGNKTVVFS